MISIKLMELIELLSNMIRSLLYKEYLLLKSEKSRMFMEIIFPLIIFLSIFNPVLPSTVKTQEESRMIENGYASSTDSSKSDFSEAGEFGTCVGYNKVIGIVCDNEFYQMFNSSIRKLNINLMDPVRFDNLDEFKKCANEGNCKKTDNELCLGIYVPNLNEAGDKYEYTIFVDKTDNTMQAQNIYSDTFL